MARRSIDQRNRHFTPPKRKGLRKGVGIAVVAIVGVLGYAVVDQVNRILDEVECGNVEDPSLLDKFGCLIDRQIAEDNGLPIVEPASDEDIAGNLEPAADSIPDEEDVAQDLDFVLPPEEDLGGDDGVRVLDREYQGRRTMRQLGREAEELPQRQEDGSLLIQRETGRGIGGVPERQGLIARIRNNRVVRQQRRSLEDSPDGLGGLVGEDLEGSGVRSVERDEPNLGNMTPEQREAYDLIIETRARLAVEEAANQ